ncbi:hypothetical protein [Solimonas flava]|uniref:hypothetical protein n=1 Tax=Solimonas flava TaxID=415849 RepID=UPI00041FF555|nr:hypothetical protein [Solimonas flava]
MPMRKQPKTDAERKALQRERGRQVAIILRDEIAIAELDRLAAQHGSQRAALEHLLIRSARR